MDSSDNNIDPLAEIQAIDQSRSAPDIEIGAPKIVMPAVEEAVSESDSSSDNESGKSDGSTDSASDGSTVAIVPDDQFDLTGNQLGSDRPKIVYPFPEGTKMPESLVPMFHGLTYLSGSVNNAEPWLIDKMLPLSGVAMTYGESGTCKTSISADKGIAVAMAPYFDYRYTDGSSINADGMTLYFAAESPENFEYRATAQMRFRDIDPEALKSRFFLMTGSPAIDQAIYVEQLIMSVKWLEATYKKPVVYIIYDTLKKSVADGSESNNDDVTLIIRRLEDAVMRLRRADGTSLVIELVHHECKTQPGVTSENKAPRGAQSLVDGTDQVMQTQKMGDKIKYACKKSRWSKKDTVWFYEFDEIEVGVNPRGEPNMSPYVSRVSRCKAGGVDIPVASVFDEPSGLRGRQQRHYDVMKKLAGQGTKVSIKQLEEKIYEESKKESERAAKIEGQKLKYKAPSEATRGLDTLIEKAKNQGKVSVHGDTITMVRT